MKKPNPFTERNIMNIQLDVYKVPVFKEIKGKEWVIYGDDENLEFNNRYGDFLIQCFDRSAKNNAIITGKANYIFGKGWTTDAIEDFKVAAKVEGFLENINSYETANDVLRQVALDYTISGGFFLEIIWEKGGKKIASINHVPFNYLRSNKDNTKFFYTKEWYKSNPKMNEDWAEFDAFDVNKPKGKQILYVKEYRPGVNTYTLPDYIGAIPYIVCDYSISNFHRNNIENNFWGGYLLNFPMTVPDQDIQDSITARFKQKHTGSDNAGRVVVTFSDGVELQPTLLNLQPSDLDKQFDILNKTVQQEIFTGHKITSGMLFGIKTEGQLGGRTELLEAWEHFYKTYIVYKQDVITRVFNNLLQVNGLPPVLKIKPIEPIGITWSESTYVSVMTKDELREKLGLPKLDVAVSNNSIVDAINSLSPLVANNVMGNLTINELRKLINLQPIPNGDVVPSLAITPTTPTAMMRTFFKVVLTEKEVAELFVKECSVEKKGDVIHRQTFTGKNFEDAKRQYENCLCMKFNTSTIEQNIINILVKNPNIAGSDIAKALTIPEKDVAETIRKLKDEGSLKQVDNEWKVDKKIVDKGNPFNEKLKVMYDYVKRSVADGPDIIDTTRDFCKAVLGSNSYFDAQKIQSFSDRLGYDVFDRGGGWWTHDGEHDPQCRHEWNLVVVKTNN